jgi:hypothetical protein
MVTYITQKIVASFATSSLQQPFSQQQGGQRNRTIKCFKDVLKFLSGGEVNQLLKTYLLSREGKQFMDQIGLQYKDESINIINNIKTLHDNTSRKNKYKILSLVSNQYTRKQLSEMGFKFSPKQFTRSRKSDIIDSKVTKGRNIEFENKYKPFLLEHSREASNRTVYIKRKIEDIIEDEEEIQTSMSNKKQCISVRYLNNSITNLYKLYKETNPNTKIKRSSFFKNIPKEYKKAKKRTDLCPICENGKKNEQCLKNLQKKISLNNFIPINIDNLKNEIECTKIHKKFVEIQRACFHAEIYNIKSQQAILLIDFKENLKLGGSPNELNQDFYYKKNCSVLGMCLIYKDENNQIKKEYKDYFSDILSHDGLFIIDCLHKLFSLDITSKFNHLSIWTDNARHFHSKEIAHCILSDIPQKYSIQIKWNFFGEYHGKNYLDGHFGLLSRWIKEAEKAQKISNKEECIKYLENQIKISNENKENMITRNKKYSLKLNSNFSIYNREDRPKYINQLSFSDFSSYQCITSQYNQGLYTIKGYMSSELKDGISLKTKITKKKGYKRN